MKPTTLPYITTQSGVRWTFTQPHPDQVRWEDIAFALARTARFNGHTKGKHIYSVAQHSCLVADYAEKRSGNPLGFAYGLLHDAAEAYLGDLCAPVKLYLREGELGSAFEHLERINLEAIFTAASLRTTMTDQIEKIVCVVDQNLLAAEWRDLMPDTPESHGLEAKKSIEPIEPWSTSRSETEFLQRLERVLDLTGAERTQSDVSRRAG